MLGTLVHPSCKSDCAEDSNTAPTSLLAKGSADRASEGEEHTLKFEHVKPVSNVYIGTTSDRD